MGKKNLPWRVTTAPLTGEATPSGSGVMAGPYRARAYRAATAAP